MDSTSAHLRKNPHPLGRGMTLENVSIAGCVRELIHTAHVHPGQRVIVRIDESALDVHLSSTDRGASTVQQVMARNQVNLLGAGLWLIATSA